MTGRPPKAADPALLERCRRGDERAYGELYRMYAGGIHRHLRSLLGPYVDAEDALQMVFEQAFRNLDRFSGRSSFSTWLHGVAVHVAMNIRRSYGRRLRAMATLSEESSHQTTESPERRVSWRQQAKKLEHLLSKVSEKRRVAFVLYYVEQLSLDEVAKQLGVTSATAWARINRARDELVRTIRRQERATDERADRGEGT